MLYNVIIITRFFALQIYLSQAFLQYVIFNSLCHIETPSSRRIIEYYRYKQRWAQSVPGNTRYCKLVRSNTSCCHLECVGCVMDIGNWKAKYQFQSGVFYSFTRKYIWQMYKSISYSPSYGLFSSISINTLKVKKKRYNLFFFLIKILQECDKP